MRSDILAIVNHGAVAVMDRWGDPNMVRRAAEVSVQQDECSGGGSKPIGPALCIGPSSLASSSDGCQLVRCPVKQCDGLLTASERDYHFRTGLETWICSVCGHQGYRSREGVIPLFRGGHEFKFSYGPSTHTITVVPVPHPSTWGTHGVNEEQLAKMAAEWALLCGNIKSAVHLGLPSEEFAEFYLYFCGT